jgi:CubicO group peptidase (beta-lactamase class C family)
MRSISVLGLLLGFFFMIPFSVACGSLSSTQAPDDQGPVQVITATTEPTSEPAIGMPATSPATQLPVLPRENEPLHMEPVSGDHRSEQMATYLANLMDEGNFLGSVLVAQNGDILLNEGYGQANVGAEIPNLPETQFRIGSLTKQFTAAAILKLQEQGLLNVQDPVAKFLPDYPRGNEITIHHLLTHTGGIPNCERRRDLPEVVQSPIPLDELIASFSGQPLEFLPGQQYRYSSSGYVVLTKIIEIASGQPYADYLENQILIPANMAYSGYDFLSPDLPNPAEGYHLTPGGPRPAILTDSSWPTGAGALYSTVGDLYRWDRALYEDDILSTASRQAFFTPWMDTGQGTDYGYGWDIGTTAGRPSIAHGGGIFGFASFMARFPEDDAVIIVLSNGIQMPPRLIAEGLAQILFTNE